MSMNYSAYADLIVSPCHERFGCEHMHVDKTKCSRGCSKLKDFRILLDEYNSLGMGAIDLDGENTFTFLFDGGDVLCDLPETGERVAD
ncbi:hypothetical protein [Geobacter sp. SVR]|uniref:hypothetical protein n=1 Tax=Geobacter sp. SVR TaxID=2495594 RepID=UPI00143F03C0|nr:hypothetical protein [Geobacter sp. SVR]BCS54109.1 hypothetical protein GSVR_24170 [Geobacter sp. SVR]GCF87592.1 hypothetical protein GSbR_41920 [Geobacter sp. SVR]